MNRFDTKDHGGMHSVIAPLGANVRHDYFAAPVEMQNIVSLWDNKVEFLEQNVLWKSHCSGIVSKYKKAALIEDFGIDSPVPSPRINTPSPSHSDRNEETVASNFIATSALNSSRNYVTPKRSRSRNTKKDVEMRELSWPSTLISVSTIDLFLTGSTSLKDAVSIIILQANGISRSDVAPLLDMLQTMLSRSSWRLVGSKILSNQILASSMLYSSSSLGFSMSGNSNLALRRSKSSSNVPSNQKITKPFYQDLARDIKHFCSHACFIFLKSDRFSKFALLSIIDILQSPCVSKNPQCYKLLQNIFVDGGIFEKILKIRLTFGMGFTDVESMYIIILRAINLLTWKNKVAKHTFYVQLGYTRLHAYLTPYIINEENKMYSSVMLREFTNVLLFEGLIWGSDYKFDSSRALISNPLALNIILEMLQFATDDDQYMTLVAIHSMLEGEYGIENCSKCAGAQPPIITQFLRIIPSLKLKKSQETAIACIQCLGSHVMTVPQLKEILRCFQVNLPVQQEESRREDIQHRDIAYNGNKVFPPMLAANLLSSLKHMVPKYPQPRQSFYLNGIDSGILLPKLYAWPKMGYTFNLWLCLRRPYKHSNPPDTTGDHSFMPSHAPAPRNRSINQNDAQIGEEDALFYATDSSTILSIDLRNGAGLEIVLVENYLHIVIGDVNLPFINRRVIKTGIAVENSAWTLLSLIHRSKVKHAKQNKNNLEIHINGLKKMARGNSIHEGS